MYTNTELSALKYHHTEEKEKKKYRSIITVFELDKGQRASVGGILSESVAWFLRAICDVWDGIYENHVFLPSTACCQRSLYRSLPSHNACTEPNPAHFIFIPLKFDFFYKFECACLSVTHKHVCINGSMLSLEACSPVLRCSLLNEEACHCMCVCIFKMDFVQGKPFLLVRCCM